MGIQNALPPTAAGGYVINREPLRTILLKDDKFFRQCSLVVSCRWLTSRSYSRFPGTLLLDTLLASKEDFLYTVL
jgi:hypothetical protein